MTPYLTALEAILARASPLPAERVALELAAGRALVQDAHAASTLPAHDNSAMDGYAVRAADLSAASASHPVGLQVAQRISAGDSPAGALSPGQAARIFTGAPLPPGADAIVMQEDVERAGERVLFRESVEAGDHVRPAGGDIRVGDLAVAAGQELGASELALLAALGETQVHVHRRPRVAVISTGDELVELGHATPGKLVDSNALAFGIRLRQLGADVVQLGVAKDSPDAIAERFRAAAGCDVVISSAGVSVGEKDHVKAVLSSLGATIHIERVAIRPGKPLVFATSPSQLFFGLPGNPVSSRVTFEVFVRPALRRLLGLTFPTPAIPAVLTADFDKVEALTFFTRVALTRSGDRLLATPMPKQGSGSLTSLVGAQALAILPAGTARVPAGAVVDVVLL